MMAIMNPTPITPQSIPSRKTFDKAARMLLDPSRIVELEGARTFVVQGDTDEYIVTLQPGAAPNFCTCDADTCCSHILFAQGLVGGLAHAA